MAEREVETVNSRFGDLQRVLELHYDTTRAKMIPDESRKGVSEISQRAMNTLGDYLSEFYSDLKLGKITLRESCFDTSTLEACVPLVIPNITEYLDVQSQVQRTATLRVKADIPENGWLAQGVLQILGNGSGEEYQSYLSTSLLRRTFERIITEVASKCPLDFKSQMKPSRNQRHSRDNSSADFELTGPQLKVLTNPPHIIDLRLIPLIETTYGQLLLTSFDKTTHTSCIESRDFDFPPGEVFFKLSSIEEEQRRLREGPDDSAVRCLRILCSLRKLNTNLSGPLIYTGLLLNCVLLVKDRKDADGKPVWPTLSRGEEFVEVMKVLLEYLMLGQLPWYYDLDVKITVDKSAASEKERSQMLLYLSKVFINRSFSTLF